MFEATKLDTEEKRTISHMASIVFNREMGEHERGFLSQVVEEWLEELRKQSREYYNNVGKGG